MAEGILAITADRILTPLIDIRDGVLLVEGHQLAAIGQAQNVAIPSGARRLDFPGCTITPGFIDIHLHGALGVRAGDGVTSLGRIASYLVEKGTTSWLPTVNSIEAVRCCREAMKQGNDGAEILGIHIEGPFLAPKKVLGFEQLDAFLHKPSLEEFHAFLETSEGHLLIMGLAPELPGATELIKEMRHCGVIPAVAHSFTTYEQFMQAVEAGAKHVTHVFQVMGLMHMRRPGVVGGALTCDQVSGELIADGVHNHPAVMEVLLRCKGPEQVALITDSSDLTGVPDGYYETYGRKRIKRGLVCREAGSTEDQDYTIAGSVCSLDHNIGLLVNKMHVPLSRAIRMATLTPATIIGAAKRKGSLEPGKDADLVVMGKPGQVIFTMVRGKVTFQVEG